MKLGMDRQFRIAFLIFILVGLSSCLKTRAQLRDESDAREVPTQAVAAPPAQDVHPQSHYVLDEIKEEITQMTGRLEDVERNQKEMAAKNNSANQEEAKKLESRVAQLEESLEKLQQSFSKLESSPVLQDPNVLFNKAKTQFDDEEYDSAISLLLTYIKIPKVKKIEEATLMLGESYFHQKQYKKAIVEYSKFPETFKRSPKMAEALYRIGLSFDALGMSEDAKGFYEELTEKFPKSPEAKKVKTKKRK